MSMIGFRTTVPILLCLFSHVTPVHAQQSAPDPHALALLTAIDKNHQSIKTLTAEMLTITRTSATRDRPATETRTSGTVALLRPNYLNVAYQPLTKIDDKWKPTPEKLVYVSDGKNFYKLNSRNTFEKQSAAADGANLTIGNFPPLQGLYGKKGYFADLIDRYQKANTLTALKWTGKKKWGDTEYDTVVLEIQNGKNPLQMTLYIGDDKIIHRLVEKLKTSETTLTFDYQLKNVKTNIPLDPNRFTYTPPKNTSLYKESIDIGLLPLSTPTD